MIGYLEGRLKTILDDGSIIVDVNGVGYNVHTVNFGSLNEDEEVALFIHTSVREDDISLWGFNSKEELSIFKLLLSVSGVGAKTALNMITLLGAETIVNSIYNEDAKTLKVKGVGVKTAEKIILDLKDKVDPSAVTKTDSEVKINNERAGNAIEALESLGYKEKDIKNAMSKLDKIAIKSMNDQELIKSLLAKL